ncbi:hypothetical protein AXG93_1129s1050 [Marchantia polymorpha subsp. ruderalis]|uniref:J domain-containing protein n=1 Tax=Marchantia polymorpha subsp. ruderalis TaxID=1480154 RepID=A0A176W122_MARPO|nr:hypothetical protein AXG93_1129s1050 [Marchantia polymorpha subsp. ruderalis]
MVHKTIFQHYVEEILGDDLKLEGNDGSKDTKRRGQSERMYQLVGLEKTRKEIEQVSTGELFSKTRSRKIKENVRVTDANANVELEKFGHLWRKCEEYASSPRLCGMEGVDVLVATEQKRTKRAEKRIPVQMMSRLCNCFMARTSLAETKFRKREIKSSKEKAPNDSEGYVRSKRRIEVDKVYLFCHGGSLREEKETPDPRRAAEQRERIQHQREKLIEPHVYTYKSNTSNGAIKFPAPPEAKGCKMANQLKNVCNAFRHQQTPQSRARPLSGFDENHVPVKNNFSESSVSVSSRTGQPTKSNFPGKTGDKVEVQNKDTSVSRTSEGPTSFPEKKQRAPSTTVSDMDTNVGLATPQLQRSTSLKEYFDAERKAEAASQAKKSAEDIDTFHEIEGESPHHRRLSSVKKVYRRASFCLHPDKVQQKGGTLEQKYVAEKVFGVLREAWNKFYSEELA